MTQLSLLDEIEAGKKGAEEGLQRAVNHADAEIPGWKDVIWGMFIEWLKSQPKGQKFLNEDFRLYVELKGLIESPPSLRAYGFICPKAARLGLIRGIGTAKVTNQTAHRANAGRWEKI